MHYLVSRARLARTITVLAALACVLHMVGWWTPLDLFWGASEPRRGETQRSVFQRERALLLVAVLSSAPEITQRQAVRTSWFQWVHLHAHDDEDNGGGGGGGGVRGFFFVGEPTSVEVSARW